MIAVLAPIVFATGLGCFEKSVVQPMPFNHLIHTDTGLACDDCHASVFKKTVAGLPSVDFCMECHGDDIIENRAAVPYIDMMRRHAEEGTEIPWVNLYSLPHHVYYSHRRHTAIAELSCTTCHGDIGESDTPPRHPIAATLNMEKCMDCHEQNGVEDDCAWCHR